VPLDKIDVAYNGVSDVFEPLAEVDHCCDGKPYFISVGSLQPRKNIARLLAAFDQACKTVTEEIQLLVVGESFYWDAAMKQAMDKMEFKGRVHFTGRMDQHDLRNAYAGALALVYVSYFEGFGIPLLEAMKCDCPVIASNATALPEVAQDAAVYCDPFDTNSIAEQLVAVSRDQALREKLKANGRERVKAFSWDRTAEAVWNSILKTING